MSTLDVSAPAPRSAPADAVRRVQSLAAADIAGMNAEIRRWLKSEVPLINEVADYLISAGGKRLRPLVLMLAARAHGYAGDQHTTLAAIIEFIHTSTLLHDDVVDESDLRRGRRTANALWGNAASVLVGDYLYSRSFQMMVAVGRPAVMEILADTTNRIAEGEVLQLLNRRNPEVSENQYLAVVERKTAVLFEASARLGALLGGGDQATLAEYGSQLGYAFQIADDVLDYSGDVSEIGKNLGDDLAEGKPTLPLIHAQQRADVEDAELIRTAIRDGRRDLLPQVTAIIRATDALESSLEAARAYSQRAEYCLQGLPDSPCREALVSLTHFAVDRQH